MLAMAMGCFVAIASCWLNCCCNQFDQYIVHAEKNMSDLRFEAEKLAAVRMDVQKKLEAKQLGNSVEVAENWLNCSAAIDVATNKVSSDYDTMFLPRLNCWSRYSIGKRTFRKILKVQTLMEETPIFKNLTTTPWESGLQEKQIETTVVGMDLYLERALELISSTRVGVIGICGMGGVGKTTLLRKIHGEFLPGKARSKEFDKVVWVVVFKRSTAINEMQNDIARLQNDIARELGLKLDKIPDDNYSKEVLEQRALPIYEYLSSKSFLLLLDDLWSHLELKYIGVPNPTRGTDSQKKHKLVLTSRSKKVCSEMNAAAPGLIDVKCLNENEAWRLFEFNVTSQTIASHHAIPNLARKVMKECQGLPLALNTIGKALSTKSGDPDPWKEALSKLTEARHVEIPGMEAANAAMLQRLKISYDYLPSRRQKDCFLSCCLWPEDFSIDKEKLIECWLGLDIITELSDSDINTAFGIITSLQQLHLLESGDNEATEVKMHDTIRDMSLWISSNCGEMKNKWLVKAGIGTKTTQRVIEQLRECSAATERVSLMNNHIHELPSTIPQLLVLKALMLQRNKSLRVVPGNFLLRAPALTYLDLSYTNIEELPSEICLLHDLQYLNLSESFIQKLPNELSSLTELRYLLAATIWLTTIPYGIISNLQQLQTLDVFGSQYASWGVTNSTAAAATNSENDKGACLDEFQARSTSLRWLGITLESVEGLKKLAMCNNVRTRRLSLTKMSTPALLHIKSSNLEGLLGGLDMLKSMQEFNVEACVQLQILIVGGSDNRTLRGSYCLPALEKLELLSMFSLQEIRFQGMTAHEFFPRLRSVKILQCGKLTNVNWTLYLPQLLHLEIRFCPAMKALIHYTDQVDEILEEEWQDMFPVLKTLVINSLVELTSLCIGRSVSFPALQVIKITQCTKLKQLSIQPQHNLREIKGGENWWRSLDWEDPASVRRSSFHTSGLKSLGIYSPLEKAVPFLASFTSWKLISEH